MLQHKKSRLPIFSFLTEKLLKINNIAIVFLLLTATVGVISQPAISDDLFKDVDANVQTAITRICQPLQFSQSSQAYRDCVLQRLENVNPEADTLFRRIAALGTGVVQGATQNTATPAPSAQTQITSSRESNIATTTEPAILPVQPPQQLARPELESTPNANAANDRANSNTSTGAAIAPWLEKIPGKPFSFLLPPLALLILLLTAITIRIKRKATSKKHIKIAEAKATFQLRPDPAGKPVKPNVGPSTHAPSATDTNAPTALHRSSNKPRHQQSIRHKSAETSDETEVSRIATADANINADSVSATHGQISESELAIFETSRHGFETWNSNASPQKRRDQCSELLILTMAYTDNRFDPELKKRIFKTKERDASILIKRWAFKQDSQALAYAIRVFQTETNRDQRIQFIDLLMALLVAENALTPIQNNFLKFLSDAFGIGREQLERQYLRAFGEPMPGVPRPDKLSWWEPIQEETLFRWDAQSIALQPEKIRYRVLLGLPLHGELDQESMLASYRRAVGRCHRERVNQLGEFEHELLNIRQKKFDMARDALMGIPA